jgi:hypothetical protein
MFYFDLFDPALSNAGCVASNYWVANEELKGYKMKQLWPSLRKSPGICRERLMPCVKTGRKFGYKGLSV